MPLIMDALTRGRRGVVSAVMGAGKSVVIAETAWCLLSGMGHDETIVVTTPTQALVQSLSHTISRRCGAGTVGVYYQHAKNWRRPVVVCCNRSLGKLAELLDGQRRRVVLWIADEVHQTETEDLKSWVGRLAPRAALGFTGTPYRSCTSQTLSLWDEVLLTYTLADALEDRVLVPWVVRNWDGEGSDDVDDFVIRQALALKGPGIVSSLHREDAEAFAKKLTAAGRPAKAIHYQVPAKTQERRMAWLREGNVLVHVNMLSEGVDVPELRWIALRRPVKARVRLVQEFGRVLRSNPCAEHAPIYVSGCSACKQRAIVVDPHDLLRRQGIAHAAALGEALDAEARGGGSSLRRISRGGGASAGGAASGLSMPGAKPVDARRAWLGAIRMCLEAGGAIGASRRYADGEWRTKPATQDQLGKVHRFLWTCRHLPDPHGVVLREALEWGLRQGMSRGGAADALDILFGLFRLQRARGWAWPESWVITTEPPEIPQRWRRRREVA